MNTETGRLVDLDQFGTKDQKRLEELIKEHNLTPVPPELETEARECLGDKSEVMVDMTKDTLLTAWAKADQQRKKKNKRRAAQKSRRRNR